MDGAAHINKLIRMTKTALIGKSLSDLQQLVSELGMPAFTAGQIADWIYVKRVASIEEMTNLSKKNRSLLAEYCELGRSQPAGVQESTDGNYEIGRASCRERV